jgi:hypothetical protein
MGSKGKSVIPSLSGFELDGCVEAQTEDLFFCASPVTARVQETA